MVFTENRNKTTNQIQIMTVKQIRSVHGSSFFQTLVVVLQYSLAFITNIFSDFVFIFFFKFFFNFNIEIENSFRKKQKCDKEEQKFFLSIYATN